MPPAAELLRAEDATSSPHQRACRHLQQEQAGCGDMKMLRSSSVVSPLDASFSFRSDVSTPSDTGLKGFLLSNEDSDTCTRHALQPKAVIKEGVPSRRSGSCWNVEASEVWLRTVNPIRRITDAAGPGTKSINGSNSAKPKKSFISLGQGDPTMFGHLAAPKQATEAVAAAVLSGKSNGYPPSAGLPAARQAVALHVTKLNGPSMDAVLPGNVYITAGCGNAVQICLEALANNGKNVLLPRPGFPVYDCWCTGAGLDIRRYSLLPEQNWEVDLEEVRALADEDTVALVLCNPGNPCGNVFSRDHIREIVGVAEELKLPIISDEVYAGITLGSADFVTTASVAATIPPQYQRQENGCQGDTNPAVNGHHGGTNGVPLQSSTVPVLTVSSISKTLLVPGWRLGWIAVQDPGGILRGARVLEAIENSLQTNTPTCALIQGALPGILSALTPEFLGHLNSTLGDALQLCLRKIEAIPGLECPSQPQGGMFLMVRIDLAKFPDFQTDVEWCRALLVEESLVVIPGTAFEFPGWFRTLLSAPLGILEEAWLRVEDFCHRHEMKS